MDNEAEQTALPPNAVTEEERQQILHLKAAGYGTRRIAERVGRNRKTVQRVLQAANPVESPPPPPPEPGASKLDLFREAIAERAEKRLTTSRILREIAEMGYTGGRTILAEHVRDLRRSLAPRSVPKRRFETPPGQESQVDWSVYTVPLAGQLRTVHVLAVMLAWARKAHLYFYLDERQSTLLEGLERAFADFGGVTGTVVFDRMATVVLGTIGRDGQPLWHPRFLDFARRYGFKPFLCKPRDPNRKGKDERFFLYLEQDLVRGSSFESLADLNRAARHWLDTVANVRVHGTTGRIPEEAWKAERDHLIRLPELRFPVWREEFRQVDRDATIWIGSTPYTIPDVLVELSQVCVRLFAEHFEVLDGTGAVAFSRRYAKPNEKGVLQRDPAHYRELPGAGKAGAGRSSSLDEAFVASFPTLAELAQGIGRRMKAFAHVHLRLLRNLAARYGQAAFLEAAHRAQEYRRFDAHAVRRILEQLHPLVEEDEPILPINPASRALHLLGDVDPGSLDDYAHLDETEPTE